MTEGAAEACISCICKRVCRETRIRCCDDANAIGLGTQDGELPVKFSNILFLYFCDANGWVVGRIMASAEWIVRFPHQLVEARLFDGRCYAMQNATFPSCARRWTVAHSRLVSIGRPDTESCARTSVRTTDNSGGEKRKNRSQPARASVRVTAWRPGRSCSR